MKNIKLCYRGERTKPSLSQRQSLVMHSSALSIVSFLSLLSINQVAMGREVQQAHTHGVADLSLVAEDGVLEMQFVSPAISGF